jgi:hypothetical protein
MAISGIAGFVTGTAITVKQQKGGSGWEIFYFPSSFVAHSWSAKRLLDHLSWFVIHKSPNL